MRPWLEGLAQRFRLVQYDLRGTGMSSRGLPPGLTMAGLQADVEAVLGRIGPERVLLFAWASSVSSSPSTRCVILNASPP